jgi:hypothetical protein
LCNRNTTLRTVTDAPSYLGDHFATANASVHEPLRSLGVVNSWRSLSGRNIICPPIEGGVRCAPRSRALAADPRWALGTNALPVFVTFAPTSAANVSRLKGSLSPTIAPGVPVATVELSISLRVPALVEMSRLNKVTVQRAHGSQRRWAAPPHCMASDGAHLRRKFHRYAP